MGWQPIETSPAERVVIIYAPGYGVIISKRSVIYDGSVRWSGGGYLDPPPEPTHWMPLPDPPLDSGKD